MKRLYAAMLTLALGVCALLPAVASAVDDPLLPEDIQYEDVTLSKSATRTDADEWEITLAVTPEGEALEYSPLELALVIDASGSMQNCALATHSDHPRSGEECVTRQLAVADAAKRLVNSLAENPSVKIGVVRFDKAGAMLKGLTDISTPEGLQAVLDAIPTVKHDSGTNITDGLAVAKTLFSYAEGTESVIVLLSDGQHNKGKGPATIAANIKEDGTLIYCIGFMVDDNVLKNLSSGEGYYKYVTDAVALQREYEHIASVLSGGVIDPIADKFLIEGTPTVSFSGTNISCNVTSDGNTVRVTPAKSISTDNTMYIRYRVKLNMQKVAATPTGIYTMEPLNNNARLESGGESFAFPVPKCSFELGRLNVRYELYDSSGLVNAGDIGAQPQTIITDWGTPQFNWNADDTITLGGKKYKLSLAESSALGAAFPTWQPIAKGGVAARAGEHALTFVYRLQQETPPTAPPSVEPSVSPKPSNSPQLSAPPSTSPAPTVTPKPPVSIAPTVSPRPTHRIYYSYSPDIPATGDVQLTGTIALLVGAALPVFALLLKKRRG